MKSHRGFRAFAPCLGVALAVACYGAGRAEGQFLQPLDPNLPPTFGSITMKADTKAASFTKELQAGGNLRMTFGGASGNVAKEPDFRLNYSAGSFPLTFRTAAAKHTALFIRLPNGAWAADENSAGSGKPALTFAKPLSGRYDIYVGTFGSDDAPATLVITEEKTAGVKPTPIPTQMASPTLKPTGVSVFPTPDWDGQPKFGETPLRANFRPDPLTKKLTAGGEMNSKISVYDLNTHITEEPSFRIDYDVGAASGNPLTFRVESSGDTTLLIHSPIGGWFADDNSNGGGNPRITFSKPPSGRYTVWVGSSNKTPVAATLFITAGSVVPTPDFTGKPNFGEAKLKADFEPDPFTKKLTAGGTMKSHISAYGLDTYITEEPSFTLNYTGGRFPLTFRVESAGDTTLLINPPAGGWIADDDSGGGVNPRITLSNPQSGNYQIWVGTFNKTPVAATLFITER